MSAERPDLELLGDLLRLVRKHGPESFTRLASLLRDAETMGTLANVLDEVAETARLSRASSQKRRVTPKKGESVPTSSLGDWSNIIERNRNESSEVSDAESAPETKRSRRAHKPS